MTSNPKDITVKGEPSLPHSSGLRSAGSGSPTGPKRAPRGILRNYLGILAAGALVSAIAPLSRLSDRVAEKAVFIANAPAAPLAAPDAHERYRLLLRRVLRDAQVTRDEDMALAQAAAGMGIAANDAQRLRHEVEGERR